MTKPIPKHTTAIQEEKRDGSPPGPAADPVPAERSVKLVEGQTDTWGARIALLVWLLGFGLLILQVLFDTFARLFHQ